MNERVRHILEEPAEERRIVLARQSPIRLPPLTLDPAKRLIVHDDGREEIVEQRVMQVLVALVRADGAILTRDDLIFCCWDGRIVGDDAINRVMSRLRRAAEGIGAGIFQVETITKVGYRLVTNGHIAGAANARAAVARARSSGTWRRRAPWLVGLIAMLIAALAAFLLLRPGAEAAAAIVRVDPFEVRDGGGAATDFSRDLAADLSRFANSAQRDFLVVEPGAARHEAADYVVRASIGAGTGRIRAVARLIRTSDGEIVWASTFERPVAEAVAMREQMAVQIADVMICSKRVSDRGGQRFGAESLRLIFAVCGQYGQQQYAEKRELLSQLVEREPSFATGWAWLASIEAVEASNSLRPEEHPLFYEARRHATRAIALDAREGYAYAVLAHTTTGRHPWVERVRILEWGISVDPDNAELWLQYAEVLRQLARLNDSLAAVRRAVALDPLSSYPFGNLIQSLAYVGQIDAATELVAEGERRWPDRMSMNRFQLAIAAGDASRALEMLESSSYLRERLGPRVALVRLDLQTRLNPSPANRQRLLTEFRRAVVADPSNASRANMLAFHGMNEEAFRLIASADLPRWEPDLLFGSDTAVMRRDPRILLLAERHGLVRYWSTSGKWPDFCADRSLPYDCRVEARRLLATR